MSFLKARTGQTMTEYVLIGSLIALVAIGSLAVLGNTLKFGFTNLIAGERKPLPAVGGQLLSDTGSGNTVNGQDTPGSGDPNLSCVSAGWCLNLGKIETKEQSATQTTGSNGDLITECSDVLKQIQKKIEQMPDVDPTLKAYVINSANAGHNIAMQQEAGSTSDVSDATISFIYRSDDLRSYINQHPNVLPSEVNEVIKLSLANIQKLSVGYMKQSQPNYYQFYQIPPNLQVSTEGDFDLSNFTKKVKKDSNTVCKAGKADPYCTKK
jgi:Flp pilus assembly pilin Flp